MDFTITCEHAKMEDKKNIFSSLSEHQIETFQKYCTEETYHAGEVVFYEGSVGDTAYIILMGGVEIWKDYDTPEQGLLAVFNSGQMFGEIAVLDDQARSATVVAREVVKLLSINRDDFYRVIKENNTISMSIMKSMSGMVRDRTDNFAEDLKARNRQLEISHRQLELEIEERKNAESALIDSKEKLRILSSHLLKAQEVERIRLSKELHDDLGQSLALLKHLVRSIEKKSNLEQSFNHEAHDHCIDYVDGIIENVRRISRDLRPSILEDLGFSAAFRSLTENFSRQYSIQISVNIIDVDDLFSMDTQTNLYRIFQDVMTNIGKHAQAGCVTFSIEKEDDKCIFVIEDDGKGFELKDTRNRKNPVKGIGLNTIEERANMLDASLVIDSITGKGTKIVLEVPY